MPDNNDADIITDISMAICDCVELNCRLQGLMPGYEPLVIINTLLVFAAKNCKPGHGIPLLEEAVRVLQRYIDRAKIEGMPGDKPAAQNAPTTATPQ